MAEREEIVAGLKIIGCLARADGVATEAERRQMAFMIEDLLPGGPSVDDLLHGELDLEAELARVRDKDFRTAVYRAAAFLSRVDGRTDRSEQEVVDRIAEAFDIGIGDRVGAAFGDTLRGQGVSHAHELDPKVRAPKVSAKIRRAEMICAVLGANPFPIFSLVTEVAIYLIQARLVEEVAGLHGHVLRRKESFGLLGATFGLGMARAAALQLVKLIPGWGSAVGAIAGFTTTHALGRAVDRHFASGGEPSNLGEDARKIFHDIRAGEARAAFDERKAELEDPETRARVDAILQESKEGKLPPDQAAERLASLE